MTKLEEGVDRRVESRKRTALFGVTPSSSGVATSSVGAEGQSGSAARLIAQVERERYGTWQQAFAERYGTWQQAFAEVYGTWQQAFAEVYGR